MPKKLSKKLCWFTTAKGGQLGLYPANVKYLCSDFVITTKDVKYQLDPKQWAAHRFALVNGCV